jgi:hypothetical protein
LREIFEKTIADCDGILAQPISETKRMATIYLRRKIQHLSEQADAQAELFIKGVEKKPWNGKL